METQRLWPNIALLLAASVAHAITLGRIDTFQATDETLGWDAGVGSFGLTLPPEQIPDGGPLGAGDGYLRLQANTFHLGARNPLFGQTASQWTGDYLAAGVTAIEMDLNHLSPILEEVQIRIHLFGPGGSFASINRTPPLAADTWQRHVFGLTTVDLQHVAGGTGVLADTLAGVEKILIRHDGESPTLPGDHPPHITATLGMDNIRAIATPGDANADGRADDDDLSLLLANWGVDLIDQPDGGWGWGEFSARAPVNDDDLSLLLASWTGSTIPGSLGLPEPATAAMLAVAGLLILRRYRK